MTAILNEVCLCRNPWIICLSGLSYISVLYRPTVTVRMKYGVGNLTLAVLFSSLKFRSFPFCQSSVLSLLANSPFRPKKISI